MHAPVDDRGAGQQSPAWLRRPEDKRLDAAHEEDTDMGKARKGTLSIIGSIVFMAMISLSACAIGEWETGSIREVSGFDNVSFATAGELIITQGDRETLEIDALASDLSNIVTEVRDGTLSISRLGAEPFSPFRAPVFRLTVKRIAALETHGSGGITIGGLCADFLGILVSSSGGVSIDSLAAESLEVRISSSGSVRVAGGVNHQDILLTSSGSYAGGRLESRSASVRVSSSGSATLRVADSLEAVVTSSGDVRYHGNPPVRNLRVTSSGRVVRLGD
jgi:Putative auto-transporter adhesin, head GIN domain